MTMARSGTRYDFALVDAFTDQPFGGNQLAVFPDADGLDERTMQQLAREFNFSETTFVLPPRDPAHTCRVRIFTPNQELPFAGHPTLGTAAVLAGSGPDRQTFVFEEGIGPVTVTVEGRVIQLHLQAPVYETVDDRPPPAAVAETLTLPADAVVDRWYAGLGLRCFFVQLAGPDLVDRATLDRRAWQAAFADSWSPNFYVFTGDFRNHADVYSRFFAPGAGVDEDPATGSAAAALVAGLAMRSPEPDGTYRLRISQGVAMGRPSTLHGTAHKQNGRLTQVTVAGQAVLIGTGTITLPTRGCGQR